MNFNHIKNKNIITIQQGSDFVGTITITQTIDNNPINLGGYTITGQLRTLDGALACTITCSVATPSTGIVNININSADTKLLTPSSTINHVWGVQLEISGTILPEIQGGALVTAEVVYE